MITDDRGHDDIVEGIGTPPDEKEDLEILDKDDAAVKKVYKGKAVGKICEQKKGSETWLCQQKVSH